MRICICGYRSLTTLEFRALLRGPGVIVPVLRARLADLGEVIDVCDRLGVVAVLHTNPFCSEAIRQFTPPVDLTFDKKSASKMEFRPAELFGQWHQIGFRGACEETLEIR